MSAYLILYSGYLFEPIDRDQFKLWRRSEEGSAYLTLLEESADRVNFKSVPTSLSAEDGKINFGISLQRSGFPVYSGDIVPVVAMMSGGEREMERDIVDIERLSWLHADGVGKEGSTHRKEDREKAVMAMTSAFEEILAHADTPEILKKRENWVGPLEFFKVFS